MPRPRKWPPSYRRHSSGQAFFRLDGKNYYLGTHGTPASWEAYRRLTRELEANGFLLPKRGQPLTVRELLALFIRHAREKYRRSRGQELTMFRHALQVVLESYASTPGADFGPPELEAVQAAMTAKGWSRRYANRQLVRIRTAWRWLERKRLVPAGTWHGLRTVPGIPQAEGDGETGVLPVPDADLAAALPHMGPVVRALVDLQLLTGARPSELLTLRPCDLAAAERVEVMPGFWLPTAGCWVHQPKAHKTSHRGGKRVILFGPKAQDVLRPFLDRPPEDYLFSPREAAARFLHSAGRRIHFAHARTPGRHYRVDSYSHAVRKACLRAGVTPFSPYRLRHSAATRLAAQFGPELARIVLGHRSFAATRIYVLDDLTKAIEAMTKIG